MEFKSATWSSTAKLSRMNQSKTTNCLSSYFWMVTWESFSFLPMHYQNCEWNMNGKTFQKLVHTENPFCRKNENNIASESCSRFTRTDNFNAIGKCLSRSQRMGSSNQGEKNIVKMSWLRYSFEMEQKKMKRGLLKYTSLNNTTKKMKCLRSSDEDSERWERGKH